MATAVNSGEVTAILHRAGNGDSQAAEQLLPLLYDELRKLAAAKMAWESAGQTLQPTALVHEAWLRLGGDHQPHWESRAHFFGAAAEAMRRILIENARRKRTLRHGGAISHVSADATGFDVAAPSADEEIFTVHEVLDRLAAQDPRKAEVVKLRYFAGLSFEQTAEVLGISEPTAKREWACARVWLFNEIKRSRAAPGP